MAKKQAEVRRRSKNRQLTDKDYLDIPLQRDCLNETDGPAGKGLMNQHSTVPGRGRKRRS